MYDDIYPRQGNGAAEFKASALEDRILFEIDFERFVEYNLDIRELIVSRMLVSGLTVVEIARHQGVSRRFITRVVASLRNKFKVFLERLNT